MHPAYSVIFFTTASGAGYGLFVWLGVAELLDAMPANWWFRFLAFGSAVVLVIAGLLSSTFHLGRPERALNAFSQWRSSWLSREGILAVTTFVPVGLFGLASVFGLLDEVRDLWALLTIIGALMTVWCTAMIYNSLITIRAWHDRFVPLIYVTLSLATGGMLFCGLASLTDQLSAGAIWSGLVTLIAGWVLKVVYWSRIDDRKPTLTTADAIGLPHLNNVKPIEAPHSQANFVMREMGYIVGRRHAQRLRNYTVIGLFVIPALCCLALLALPIGLAPLFGLTAVLSAAAGVLTERWLFFAEAQHVVSLYYGAEVV